VQVLITGGAGFIGSTLAQSLHLLGHAVTVLDNLSTGRIDNLSGLLGQPHFIFREGSVTDAHTVGPLMAACDVCYHLAAPVGVQYIMQHPVRTILENIRGIDVVMEAAARYHRRILIASTSEVYGRSLDLLDPDQNRRLKETDYRIEGDTQNHRWAYANSKALDEFLALAYYKEQGTPVVIVRFFNTVGPRQLSQYGMVIPRFVEAALAGRDLVVYGTGEQRRSFLHVADVVQVLPRLMDHPDAYGQVFNLGNPEEITINELARLVIKQTGSSSAIRHVSYEEAYGSGFEDMNRRTADISKIDALIGLRLKYGLADILEDVIATRRQSLRA
jgi:UDP-glucose 4-epimerase